VDIGKLLINYKKTYAIFQNNMSPLQNNCMQQLAIACFFRQLCFIEGYLLPLTQFLDFHGHN
jgi:hypothetical protein